MGNTNIPYLTEAWQIVTGCTKASIGCDNCYARRLIATRLQHLYPQEPFFHEKRLSEPYHWRKPRIVGVGFMGDLFHKDIPDDAIADAYKSMMDNRQHIFVVLTKRSERMADFVPRQYCEHGPIPFHHIWHMVSVENQPMADLRIPHLLMVPGKLGISVEPMLGPIDLTGFCWRDDAPGLTSHGTFGEFINWVVCGGESGRDARSMHPDWPRIIRDDCQAAGVPFFFKQWGEFFPQPYGDWRSEQKIVISSEGTSAEVAMWRDKKRAMECGHDEYRRLDGKVYDQIPEEFKVIHRAAYHG